MRSSSGQHWVALDHVRAVAAFMVFTWHFAHGPKGFPVPFEGAPAFFPLALLDEGHTGVAVFMTLSGYLFAKLIDGKRVHYPSFFWNRCLRIVPLLIVTLFLFGLKGWLTGTIDIAQYCADVIAGLLLPTWPNGAWSIAVEAHFYLLLPLLMSVRRRTLWWPALFLGSALTIRSLLYLRFGEVEYPAYWTIVGRIDQFVFGILAFEYRALLRGRHVWACVVALAFAIFFYLFDRAGGLNLLGQRYPSPNPLWIIMPTIEGATFGMLIGYYDTSFTPQDRGFSRFLALAGTYSFSIYLLHFFIVFRMARLIDRFVDLTNVYMACLASLLCFIAMMGVGWASFRFIEAPFLRFRVKYILPNAPPATR